MRLPTVGVLLWCTVVNALAAAVTPRQIAHQVLLRCVKSEAYAERALQASFSKHPDLSSNQRAQATELVYGCMRGMALLDYQLSKLTKADFARKTHPQTLCALRLGAYELLHMHTPDHAAVNEAVELAGSSKGQRSFANGVLRNLVRRRERGHLPSPAEDPSLSQLEALAVETSTPGWLLHELGKPQGGLNSFDELQAWARATQLRPQIALRVNKLRAERSDIQQRMQSAGLTLRAVEELDTALLLDAGGGRISALPGFEEGEWSVQDVGAQIVGHLAIPDAPEAAASGDRFTVLDLCAAPGGKTTHMAELLGGNGQVLSVEVHPRKTKLIEQSCERLGLSNVAVAVADATDPQALLDLLARHGRGDAGADAVVLDAPCSGTGTLRRNPEHRYRSKDADELLALSELQGRLLDSAARAVRIGGTLTYSVCSPLLAETEEAVAAFLKRHAGAFEIVEPSSALAAFHANSAPLGGDATCVRTWTHLHAADSHFAASMRRVR